MVRSVVRIHPELPTRSAAPLRAFRGAGFVLLERFLEADELRPLRREVDARLEQPVPSGCERPHNTLAPLGWDDAIVQRVLSSQRRRAALSDAIGADDLRWISAYISVKPPRSAALWWHQDWWCWDHPVTYRPAASQVAVLCYLTDTTARNGALRVLPGTHHRSTALHAELPEPHAGEADGLPSDHASMRDHPDQVTIALRAGDAVALDYRLLHGTHPNPTRRRRDCLVFAFTPSWRHLPADVRAHLIRHPALPTAPTRQISGSWAAELLPRYRGRPRDLPLSRAAPSDFAMPADEVRLPGP